MAIGFGATLVPTWFSYVFTYAGGNTAKKGFFNAIVLVCENGFAINAFIALILNLILKEEIETEEATQTEARAVREGSTAESSNVGVEEGEKTTKTV